LAYSFVSVSETKWSCTTWATHQPVFAFVIFQAGSLGVFFVVLFCLVVLGFELRASSLLGERSTTRATLPARISCFLPRANLGQNHNPFPSAFRIAGIKSMNYHAWPLTHSFESRKIHNWVPHLVKFAGGDFLMALWRVPKWLMALHRMSWFRSLLLL
jgi:hypothetical protein